MPLGAPGKKRPFMSHMGLGSGRISKGLALVGAHRGTCQLPNRLGADSLLNCYKTIILKLEHAFRRIIKVIF